MAWSSVIPRLQNVKKEGLRGGRGLLRGRRHPRPTRRPPSPPRRRRPGRAGRREHPHPERRHLPTHWQQANNHSKDIHVSPAQRHEHLWLSTSHTPQRTPPSQSPMRLRGPALPTQRWLAGWLVGNQLSPLNACLPACPSARASSPPPPTPAARQKRIIHIDWQKQRTAWLVRRKSA